MEVPHTGCLLACRMRPTALTFSPDEVVIAVLDGLAGTDALTHLRPDDGGSEGGTSYGEPPTGHASVAIGCGREPLPGGHRGLRSLATERVLS